jgi:hypothetical protein
MSEKLGFCLLLIRVQGSIEDRLKVGGGRGRGRGCVGVSLGHGPYLEGEKRLMDGRAKEHCSLVF